MGDMSDDLSKRKKQAEQDLHHLGRSAPTAKGNSDIGDPISFIFDMFKEACPGFDITDQKKDKMLKQIREDITEISTKFLALKMDSGEASEDGGENIAIEGIGIELKSIKDELKRLAHSGLTEDQMFAELERILNQTESLKAKTERETLEHNFEEYVEEEKREQDLEEQENDREDEEFVAEQLKQDKEEDEEQDRLEQEEEEKEKQELSESFLDDNIGDLAADKPSQNIGSPNSKADGLSAQSHMEKPDTPKPNNEPEGPKPKRPRLG
jgi:hypothetical protein